MKEYYGIHDIDPNNVVEICQWAREYGKAEQPADNCIKFGIGIYQLKQMMDWKKGIKKANRGIEQSAGAFVIHVLSAVEMAAKDICAGFLPKTFSELPIGELDFARFTYALTTVQQQLIYIHQVDGEYGVGNVRASRINLKILGYATAVMVSEVLKWVPRELRSVGIELESEILIKRNWKYERSKKS